MDKPFKGITLDQELKLREFQLEVEKMSREQAQDFLMKVYRQMIVRENIYKEFLKKEWGIGESFYPQE